MELEKTVGLSDLLLQNLRLKKILLILFVFISISCSAQDSLKIFAIGEHFRSETYRVIIKGEVFEKKVGNGLDVFAFNIPLPPNLEDGDILDVQIYSKSKFSFKYKNTITDIQYDDNRKYCVLYRSNRVKKRFAFEPIWLSEPLGFGPPSFWNLTKTEEEYRMKKLGKS